RGALEEDRRMAESYLKREASNPTVRSLHRFGICLFAVFLPALVLGQGAPIAGSAPVILMPSAVTPVVNDQITVEARVDLTGVLGVPAGGTSTLAVLSGFSVPVSFDQTRLRLVSVGSGQDPLFAANALDSTDIVTANDTGRLLLVN